MDLYDKRLDNSVIYFHKYCEEGTSRSYEEWLEDLAIITLRLSEHA